MTEPRFTSINDLIEEAGRQMKHLGVDHIVVEIDPNASANPNRLKPEPLIGLDNLLENSK